MTTPSLGSPQRLTTGEAVQVDLRVARMGSRMVAGVIDLALQFVILGIALFIASKVISGSDDDLGSAVVLVVVVGCLLVLPVACETMFRGRTPGKAALGLRVVRDDGGPIRFRHAFVRGLLGFVVEKPGFTFGAAAVICSMVNSRAKRLGDLLAGTLVLQERIPSDGRLELVMPPQLAGWAATLDLARAPQGTLLAARQLLGRWTSLTPTAQETLSQQIAGELVSHLTPPPPPGTPAWAFLLAVLAEQRRRAAGVSAAPPMTNTSPAAPPMTNTSPAAPPPVAPLAAVPPPAAPGPFAPPG